MNNARRLPAIAHSAAAEALATAGEGDRTLRKGNTAARTVKPKPLYREAPPRPGQNANPSRAERQALLGRNRVSFNGGQARILNTYCNECWGVWEGCEVQAAEFFGLNSPPPAW